jgi:hypothetical protein
MLLASSGAGASSRPGAKSAADFDLILAALTPHTQIAPVPAIPLHVTLHDRGALLARTPEERDGGFGSLQVSLPSVTIPEAWKPTPLSFTPAAVVPHGSGMPTTRDLGPATVVRDNANPSTPVHTAPMPAAPVYATPPSPGTADREASYDNPVAEGGSASFPARLPASAPDHQATGSRAATSSRTSRASSPAAHRQAGTDSTLPSDAPDAEAEIAASQAQGGVARQAPGDALPAMEADAGSPVLSQVRAGSARPAAISPDTEQSSPSTVPGTALPQHVVDAIMSAAVEDDAPPPALRALAADPTEQARAQPGHVKVIVVDALPAAEEARLPATLKSPAVVTVSTDVRPAVGPAKPGVQRPSVSERPASPGNSTPEPSDAAGRADVQDDPHPQVQTATTKSADADQPPRQSTHFDAGAGDARPGAPPLAAGFAAIGATLPETEPAPAAAADAPAEGASSSATDARADDAGSLPGSDDAGPDVASQGARIAAGGSAAVPAPLSTQTGSAAAAPAIPATLIAGAAAPPAPACALPPSFASASAATAGPAPDIDALAMAMAATSARGLKHFDIRLDPPELGRVDVHLSVGRDGKAEALLTVDRPDTLEFLRRDSVTLQRALRDAGLDLSNNSLNFSLKGQQRQGDGGGASTARMRSLSDAVVARAEAANASTPIWNHASDGARLDIRV